MRTLGDRVAFERALQSPRRNLGLVAVERSGSFAEAEGIDLISALIRAPELRGIKASQAEAASELGLALAKLVVERAGRGLGATVAQAILASGLPRPRSARGESERPSGSSACVTSCALPSP